MDDGGPLRAVAAVVGGLTVLFVGVLVAAQFSDRGPAAALTLPLSVILPLSAGVGYYYYVRSDDRR